MRRIRHLRTRGFTLIEVMAATMVFMVGMLGMMAAFADARGSTARARREMHANAVARDLAEAIETWSYDDSRLAVATSEPCKTDPVDSAGALATAPSGSTFQSFKTCANGEASLTAGGKKFAGLAAPSFDIGGATETFTRLWTVREEKADGSAVTVANSGQRKRVWVFVAYEDGARHKVIRLDVTKVNRGALR